MKLASFDIFDTTLLRRCGKPDAVWELLAKHLFPEDDDLCEAFVAWRKQANGNTLQDIYNTIDSAFLTFAKKNKEEFIRSEEEVEKDVLIANPTVCETIKQRRKEGYNIAFISDMYLSSNFLQCVLKHQKCYEEGDYIYVSCEHNARKDTGKLYDVVKHSLHPTKWIHYGDNRKSDIKIPRRKGIRSIYIDTKLNDVEKVCYNVAPLQTALSRLYRLQHKNNIYAAFAADFVIPAYLPYIISVLRKVQEKGIQRLYFLSRDSYILLKAAQTLTTETKKTELHYLFVSRRSLLLPYLYGEDEKAYLAASDHHTLVRIDSIDKRLSHLGTSREELETKFGIVFPYAKINNLHEQNDFLNKIFHSDFTPLLQQRACEQYELLSDYFRQEELLDGVSCAAVDVGWLGTSRLMINHILRRMKTRDLHFFYYGVRKDVFPPSAGRFSSFFKTEELSTETTILLEHYFSASPYPTTIAYKRENNITLPVFSDNKQFCHSLISQENQTAIETIAAMFQELPKTDFSTLRNWALQSLAVLHNPNLDIDVTPLSKNNNFGDNLPFAKRLTLSQLFQFIVLGSQITGYDWGSLRLTVPRKMLSPIWKLHLFTSRLRVFLYQRLYKHHSLHSI